MLIAAEEKTERCRHSPAGKGASAMAKPKEPVRIIYSEPEDFFPKEIREKYFGAGKAGGEEAGGENREETAPKSEDQP